MSEKKKEKKGKQKANSDKIKITTTRKPSAVKNEKSPDVLSPTPPRDLWQAFDDVFERFRNDFEELLFPTAWSDWISSMPETRIPVVDLEDRDKEFVLKAEMPGFKKENIEIEVQDDSVSISGNVGWTYDQKDDAYLCKERACESFYRRVELPEEIKVDEVDANLFDGVLELKMPKKTPKKKRKVEVK